LIDFASSLPPPLPGPLPLLYTFRRCPYAMRARLAIAVSGVSVREHEVDLKAKPAEMLAISPKGTVPVLHLQDGRVIEQSLDIMRWALAQHDPQSWLHADSTLVNVLIAENDGAFKRALDRYKYPERHPEKSQAAHRADGEVFIAQLETLLSRQNFLCGSKASIADAAIMPFVRQFAAVDSVWWHAASYSRARAWLNDWTTSPLFEGVMKKR
jgi:glutathione S-transferase